MTFRWPGVSTVATLILTGCGSPSPTLPPQGQPTPRPLFVPIVAAAGDISCAPGMSASCMQMATAEAIGRITPVPHLVLALGDNQYDSGELENFLAMYQPSWGRFKTLTRPVPGNHEYQMRGARGYFDYFNGADQVTGPAGERGFGYYSFDMGAWHFVALNSNCPDVGGCQMGSPQEVWLREDLAASDSRCTIAYFHNPLFASGPNGNNPQMTALWQALYAFDADVVLSAHDHVYERYAPQTPQGVLDPARGIRQFVVGTGGHSLTQFVNIHPNSEVRNNETFGVLRMELGAAGYRWEFRPVIGGAFTDSGTGVCH